MSRRVDQQEASTVKVEIRLTDREKRKWQELAAARVQDLSTMIRQLVAREYAAEFPGRSVAPVAASKRPRKG